MLFASEKRSSWRSEADRCYMNVSWFYLHDWGFYMNSWSGYLKYSNLYMDFLHFYLNSTCFTIVQAREWKLFARRTAGDRERRFLIRPLSHTSCDFLLKFV